MANSGVYFSKEIRDYNEIDDNELVELAKNKDKVAVDFLMEKYKDCVNAKASKYFYSGGEKDDLIQEGLIRTI